MSSSTDYYKNKLKIWGLEEFVTNFEKEGISDDSSPLLANDREIINFLIPKIGPRLIFWKKFWEDNPRPEHIVLDKFLNETTTTVTSAETDVETVPSGSLYSYSFAADDELCKALDINDEFIENLKDHENKENFEGATTSKRTIRDTSDPTTNDGQKKPRLGLTSVFPEGLEAILSKYTDGKIVLFQKNKLNNCLRQKLVKVIITELFAVYGLEIKSSIFIKVAKEIQDFFPNECAATYFLPYECCNDGDVKKSVGPRGKLYTKYVNSKTQLRLANAQKDYKIKQKAESPKSGSEKDSLEYLKVSIEPYQRVLDAWQDSIKARKNEYRNVPLDIIYDSLPCLKQSYGIELIETDFNRKYPESTDIIYNTWPKVAKAIVKEASERNIRLPACSDEDIQAILSLPYLFQPTTIKKSRKGCNWRPSRTEIQESFFIQVENTAEIDEKRALRKAKLAQYGLTLQPYACIVGNLENPRYVIVVEECKYFLKSCIRTIELLFKLFYALDVQFPAESEHIWMFLGEQIFKIKSEFKTPSVNSMISDLAFHLSNEEEG